MGKSYLDRTLESLGNGSIITPILEAEILKGDWPSYTVKVENERRGGRKWNDRFHPSTDITKPELQLYYEKHPDFGPNLPTETFHPSVLLAFQIGTALHAMFEALFVKMGLTSEEMCEVYFKEERLGISGLCDVKELWLPDGRKPLVDIKTTAVIPTKVKPEHALQVMLYLDLIDETPKELGSVLYISKGSGHQIRDFTVTRDTDALDNLYKKWKRVREHIEYNSPEDLQLCCAGKGSQRYQSCPARQVCIVNELGV